MALLTLLTLYSHRHRDVADFYRDLFGLREVHVEDDLVALAGAGVTLCVHAVDGQEATEPTQTLLIFSSDDLRVAASKARELGAEIASRRVGGVPQLALDDPDGRPVRIELRQ